MISVPRENPTAYCGEVPANAVLINVMHVLSGIWPHPKTDHRATMETRPFNATVSEPGMVNEVILPGWRPVRLDVDDSGDHRPAPGRRAAGRPPIQVN